MQSYFNIISYKLLIMTTTKHVQWALRNEYIRRNKNNQEALDEGKTGFIKYYGISQ